MLERHEDSDDVFLPDARFVERVFDLTELELLLHR